MKMHLGNRLFPTNLIQGPLAGVSCAPFRLLTTRYSNPAFSCTEMISCKTLLHHPKRNRRFITKDPNEGPVCFQLSAEDPAELAEAVKKVTDYGADLIDLNCGCPVKKIRRRGAGSRLLADPLKLFQLIQAMKNNTHVPVSVKIRVDGASADQLNQQVATAVTEAGADFLVVHGRHWTDKYDKPCQYNQIKFFVDTLKIPVIGNGDVKCLTSLKNMLTTGCHGVMLSRAGVGQPWLIAKLLAEIQQQPFILPTLSEISDIFLEHAERLILLMENERASVLQMRTFAKYYARTMPEKASFMKKINECHSFKQLRQICQCYFN